MTYSTLMVHMEVGSANDTVLRVTLALAQRLKAGVIGVAACQPMPMLYGDAYAAGDMITENLAEIAKETTEAEARFRTALHDKVVHLEWRSVNATMQLADFITHEARSADLVITGPDQGFSALDSSRRVVISHVVLQAGRPVLIVPPDAGALTMERIVVAWKDTREARRAIADALPLLKAAGRVFVVEVAAENDAAAAQSRIEDVVAWLGRHGVAAECFTATSAGGDAAQLSAVMHDKRADLLVAGAYGHNRLREWALGGVTRQMLVRPSHCSLLSH